MKLASWTAVVFLTLLSLYARDAKSQSLVQNVSLNSSVTKSDSLSFNFKPTLKQPLSADYATQHYGFFCRQELLLDKKTVIPFRFRLGSMQECNRLEGKTK